MCLCCDWSDWTILVRGRGKGRDLVPSGGRQAGGTVCMCVSTELSSSSASWSRCSASSSLLCLVSMASLIRGFNVELALAERIKGC